MSDNVENATLEILKSIQASIARLEARFESRIDEVDQRLSGKMDALSTKVAKFQRDLAGTLVMMRATAGDFDRRVTEVEDRATALEREPT